MFADSTDAVMKLLTTGSVDADDPDWLHGMLNWGTLARTPTLARSLHVLLVGLLPLTTLVSCVPPRAQRRRWT